MFNTWFQRSYSCEWVGSPSISGHVGGLIRAQAQLLKKRMAPHSKGGSFNERTNTQVLRWLSCMWLFNMWLSYWTQGSNSCSHDYMCIPAIVPTQPKICVPLRQRNACMISTYIPLAQTGSPPMQSSLARTPMGFQQRQDWAKPESFPPLEATREQRSLLCSAGAKLSPNLHCFWSHTAFCMPVCALG